MKAKQYILAIFLSFFVLTSIYVMNSPSVLGQASDWTGDWLKEANGYGRAMDAYVGSSDKAMAVYIYVGWCPYCRKFERDILASPQVMEFMKDKIKVRVNPEDGERENAIVDQYQIRGFPSFFIHSAKTRTIRQIPTNITPEQFIQIFQKASDS